MPAYLISPIDRVGAWLRRLQVSVTFDGVVSSKQVEGLLKEISDHRHIQMGSYLDGRRRTRKPASQQPARRPTGGGASEWAG